MTIPISFARPDLLWLLLLLLPLLAAAGYRGSRKRRAMLQRLGPASAIAALSSLKTRRRMQSRLCLLGAVLLMVVTLAGPRWGRGDSGVVIGRDLMVVLDLSKSMLADDMRDPDGRDVKERWKAARAGIHELVNSIKQRGGHRIGLVVFAAKPWIACPLTADYDHFAMRLDEFDPIAPPREVNPVEGEQFPSGTRIGAAIVEAVRAHDPRFPGYQDLLMISDGDDPAPDVESEIETGIQAAQEANIPVHVVGVGDPNSAVWAIIPRLGADDEIIGPTRLVETPLKEIARQTRGEYYSAQREVPKLAEFFKSRIESRPSRELPDDALPQPKERYLWFLGPALVLLLAAWRFDP
jgi:Ca-activated chloride channel family protein